MSPLDQVIRNLRGATGELMAVLNANGEPLYRGDVGRIARAMTLLNDALDVIAELQRKSRKGTVQ